MTQTLSLTQDPAPGARAVAYRGDVATFVLRLSRPAKGAAWLRTNIGRGRIVRREIVRSVQASEMPLGRDWFDIPMHRSGHRTFHVRLPLCETGHFQAKCLFVPEGERTPLWPPGANTAFNVSSADSCCANIIYNAFVRQFGPNKDGSFQRPELDRQAAPLDQAGYTVIPPSGKFRDLIRELDFIMNTLGCRILQLLPIHPTPTTYGRMGRFGSPFAALSFTDVDPALAEFDPKATPMDQFIELLDAVHTLGGKVLLDIAINHTGWAANLHESHPEWLSRDAEGRIENPGAWGVVWEDLAKLDYRHQGLWRYMAEVFLRWCGRGVDGFRCDAGYMVPVDAWCYIIAKVRDQFPDTLFLLEGLGGKISVTRQLLNEAGFDWAYSELFQNYDRGQIEHYLPLANDISATDGVTVHFAETHDNDRLAARSPVYARMRTAMCALLSHQGAFGFANGVEWFADEKLHVHESRSLNWGAAENQVEFIGRISTLLRMHPAFHHPCEITLAQTGAGNYLAVVRHHLPTDCRLLVAVNLDPDKPVRCRWRTASLNPVGNRMVDLLCGDTITVATDGEEASVGLEPGQVLCLEEPGAEVAAPAAEIESEPHIPERILVQRSRAKFLEVYKYFHGVVDLGSLDVDAAAAAFRMDPAETCRAHNPQGEESRLIVWRWPEDLHREVMVPPDHLVLVEAEGPFRVRLVVDEKVRSQEESLPGKAGRYFALLVPGDAPARMREAELQFWMFLPTRCEHRKAPLLLLCRGETARVRSMLRRRALLKDEVSMLDTNGRGGMLRASSRWGCIDSRYDALLAANLHPAVPVDRWVLLSRCRGWLVYQGFSQELSVAVLDAFGVDEAGSAHWRFLLPCGQGAHVRLSIAAEMIKGRNAVRLAFHRHRSGGRTSLLEDDDPVHLILRPDIEDRSFHETTKAYTGPETRFPAAVAPRPDGFVFTPAPERRLVVRLSEGSYFHEPEWEYMVYRPKEDGRGMDPHSDLFSPGYLETAMKGGDTVWMTAEADGSPPGGTPSPEQVETFFRSTPETASLTSVLRAALDHFIVRRDADQTIIAGYPWFLDWGRDALIVLRCLIQIGRLEEARAVIQQFCLFEQGGTVPNMIRGDNTGNRDTSDAPLWLVLVCGELAESPGGKGFLEEPVGERSVRQVMEDIGHAYMAGTGNGICMDPESGLIFSPSHFTWMDTDHPAGTPRQGYPVEIQALWFRALQVLARTDLRGRKSPWKQLARTVSSSIRRYFYRAELGYLADCLHAEAGVPASGAEPDDALRSNQLLAVSLGAITETETVRHILDACQCLLVPGAIRSLADRPVRRPLEIRYQGKRINDPHRPYWGRYEGDEDSRRKPAYHNGTAWTWPFPSFCEAWAQVYGDAGRKTALAWLASGVRLIETGCLGQVPEILDGDFPHGHRGCDAQAWGVSELLRVWEKLGGP
ncbi:MAG: glycogen debranching enzyme N-terminal domain-containing protein [Desulfobacteraceae bacterium]|nr:glycogen debranching enzyme N-terminal domain-containing protein [Desulfobacteraceae bacterium]